MEANHYPSPAIAKTTALTINHEANPALLKLQLHIRI
jgi:hypothetical protein